MENEHLVLCDLKSFTNNQGVNFYYMVIYSGYEYIERVYISKDDFEFIAKNLSNIKISNFLTRTYNKRKNSFVLRFRRK